MTMSNDEIIAPNPTRSRHTSHAALFAAPHRMVPSSIRTGAKSPRKTRVRGPGFPIRIRRSSANPFAPLTREQRLARLEALAKLLDVAFILPGTNIRYGIDGLIGLIPIVGDLITTAISLWLVREARALGAPWHMTTRMLANVAVDGVVGLVPFAGDAFDVMFRANVRNVRLLRAGWRSSRAEASNNRVFTSPIGRGRFA